MDISSSDGGGSPPSNGNEYPLLISETVSIKILEKHNVSDEEAQEAFANYGEPLMDDRSEHETNPPTFWFLAPTDAGRLLKLVFIFQEDATVQLKTAYEPSDKERKLYKESLPNDL